jgi:Domain of unknown function (DUF5916)/Carbohydrate family 9 binding domain-like
VKIITLLLACGLIAQAQTDSTKRYTTAWVQGTPPIIDGLLNDEAWNQVEWTGGDFRQVNPDKGKPATVQTKFKILYDAKNLYAIFRCYDPEPSKIVKRMSRRDSFDGDWVELHIDSYYDKRTAFSFTTSVSGVKSDEYVSNNGDDWDASWDPIWYTKTSIDAEGWIAEIRIPLSQLRFANKPDLIWGLNVQRRFFRNQENSRWQYIAPDAAGYVHLMGEMNGISGIKPQKQLEIQPYVVAKTETFEKEEGNPYLTGKSSTADVGLDAKIGLTSDITLDLTVNPDFGQVEADPSQVNLTAFELYFREQRPFFIEGNNTLNFPVAFDNNNLFYSRRIGRQPQVGSETDLNGDDGVNEYVKPNGRTTILGAAKLTGKNKKGFSWGLLESVTSREYSEIDSLGFKRKQLTEPLTNYFVMRAQQDINKGNTLIGGMFTATNRKLDNPRMNWLHRDAYTGGIDFVHHWKKREYYVSAKGMVSQVKGSKEAIQNTQLSSERFFQRPDNHHTEYDPNRKSLTGMGGQFIIGKKSGNLVSDLGVTWLSPGLELNDIGFLPQTDNINQWFWMQYRMLKPKGITRSRRFNINQWHEWDFGGKSLSNGFNVNAHAEFNNVWQSGGGVTYRSFRASNADLRGGPTLRYPGMFYYWWYMSTDNRKKFYVMINPEFGVGQNHYSREFYLDFRMTWRPMNALNISLAPTFSSNQNEMQYVTTADVKSAPRYVVGRIDQKTIRLVMRATYMLTPNLSIQYYGQPFGTAGKYSNFKSVTSPSASDYQGRFTPLASALSFTNDTYSVDENGDAVADYSFGKPDFNFGQFRSNMVMRWEYIPGSTFFLVWTRERNGAFYDNHPDHEKYSFDFDQKGHNIFLMKFTYRFRA